MGNAQHSPWNQHWFMTWQVSNSTSDYLHKQVDEIFYWHLVGTVDELKAFLLSKVLI